MYQAEFEQHVGRENICLNITDALARAKALCAEIGDKAPAIEHWGRRKSDHETHKAEATASSL
jgi:hypothetical protein